MIALTNKRWIACLLIGCGLTPTSFAEDTAAAAAASDAAEAEESKDWVVRGAIGWTWFTSRKDQFSQDLVEDILEIPTVRLEFGRNIGAVYVGGVGQISSYNGLHWGAQDGGTKGGFVQGDSHIIQVGATGRLGTDVGFARISGYLDLSAAFVPLLMEETWYNTEVLPTWGADSQVHTGVKLGVGLGATFGIPLGKTGIDLEVSTGLSYVTKVDLFVQMLGGMSASF